MKAEIASETSKSRSQTEKTGKPREPMVGGLLTSAAGELVGLASSFIAVFHYTDQGSMVEDCPVSSNREGEEPVSIPGEGLAAVTSG